MSPPPEQIPLRGADTRELSWYLTRAWWQFQATYGRAASLRQFAESAHIAGVGEVIHARTCLNVEDMQREAADLFTELGKKELVEGTLQRKMAAQTIASAESTMNLATAVVVHAAFEEFLFRMCRLGLVFNRAQAVKWNAEKTVPLAA